MNKKIIAIILCAALCLTGVFAAFAMTGGEEEESVKAPSAPVSPKAEEPAKDETVYVLAKADGSVRKIIVSDWLKNTMGEESLADCSELTDIENVKGDETFSGEVWNAGGNDIYYQGGIEKELPVGMSVTYTLDGKTLSAEELAGKSGRVTIRFDYENRQTETVTLDGREEKMYVPFAVLTGMLLDNECFRNVEVTNGKLINDGDRTAVILFALPGLQENLGIGKDVIDIPAYAQIEADVTELSLGMTVTVAANELFEGFDTGKLDKADDLAASCEELESGMRQILDGSSALYDGLETLLASSEELVGGIDALAKGAASAQDGAASLNEGAQQLKAGAQELSAGLDTLKGSNDTLNGGAAQVFATLLGSAEAQLKAGGVPVPALTAENYAEILTGLAAKLGEGKEGAQSVLALKAALDSYNAFYQGLLAYTGGVASAAEGAASLSAGTAGLADGASKLKAGTKTLSDGLRQLNGGAPALKDGVKELADGAMQLRDGLSKFNEEGISKLTALLSGDLPDLTARLRASVEAAENYRNFSGIGEETEGQVRFIYRTDEIR